VSFDAIVKGGTNADKTVFTKYSDLRGGPADSEAVVALPGTRTYTVRKKKRRRRPKQRRTESALGALVSQQTALNDKPSGSAIANAATSHNEEVVNHDQMHRATILLLLNELFKWFRLNGSSRSHTMAPLKYFTTRTCRRSSFCLTCSTDKTIQGRNNERDGMFLHV
jgi:hypothetical protein